VEASIHEKAAKLDQFYDQIMSCRVIVEAPHGHHHKGNLCRVRIDLTVPDGELLATCEHHHKDHSHEDVYVAIRDAFDAMKRQLEDYARKRRGKVKKHEPSAHGRVFSLSSEEGYGGIETPDEYSNSGGQAPCGGLTQPSVCRALFNQTIKGDSTPGVSIRPGSMDQPGPLTAMKNLWSILMIRPLQDGTKPFIAGDWQ